MDMRKLRHDPRLVALIEATDQKTLAIWAKDCVSKYMHLISDKHPLEKRPQEALDVLQKWIDGDIKMWDARKYTFPTLDAARELELTDKVACQIARACSHALATCHVKTHSEGPAMYVVSALYILYNDNKDVLSIMDNEREWQIKHLEELISKIL